MRYKHIIIRVVLLLFTISTSFAQITDLRQLIGLNVNSQELEDYITTQFKISEVTDAIFGNIHIKSKSQGISIGIDVDNGNNVYRAFLYNQDIEGHEKYQGPIPYYLTFEDSQEELITKLGAPNWKRKGESENHEWNNEMTYYWELKGVSIAFSMKSIREGHPKINTICISAPNYNYLEDFIDMKQGMADLMIEQGLKN